MAPTFSNSTKFRPGVGITSDYLPTPFILTKKTIPSNNVVVGDDQAQIRFLEQMLLKKAEPRDRVTDESLLGQEGLLLQVFTQHSVDLSLDVAKRTGIWSADPITSGSAAINAIVKHAAQILGLDVNKTTKDVLQRVADKLTRDTVFDVRGTIWAAVVLLADDQMSSQPWTEPWKDHVRWMSEDVDPVFRLNSLYKVLVGYTFLRENNTDSAKKFGISPSKQTKLKDMRLNAAKVYASICELSAWKNGYVTPYICALKISAIWA